MVLKGVLLLKSMVLKGVLVLQGMVLKLYCNLQYHTLHNGTARYGTARYSTINMVLQGVHFLAPLLFFLFFPALLIGVRFQENPDF